MRSEVLGVIFAVALVGGNAAAHRDFRPSKECKRATASQIAELNRGNSKTNLFLQKCTDVTGALDWCQQLIQPSTEGLPAFRCTYGDSQIYRFLDPDETHWKYAFKAVQLIQRLKQEGISACEIYYWWRPEPFNTNAGGAPTRHPFSTSVDVRFCSMTDMERAHSRLCAWRKNGELRALGYYNSPELHFGIGDSVPNTWGKGCP